MSSLIDIEGLWKVFGENAKLALKELNKGREDDDVYKDFDVKAAVRDVSLQIQEGEIFVVMGLSGSGKSTLLRMINGLIKPTAGRLTVLGQSFDDLSDSKIQELRRSLMGMVFQSFALFPHRTALENAAFGLEVKGAARRERLRKAKQALESVGLAQESHKFPKQLSGGMQQRVGLARALALDPPVLLMDEAFSALDPLIRREMQEQLLELQKKKPRTIIFISHDLDEAVRIGDRIALMKAGRVLQCGAARELMLKPADEQVRRFFRDVDASSVMTVEAIAEMPTSHQCIVDSDGILKGVEINQGEFIEAKKGSVLLAGTTIRDAMETVALANYPVPVIDDKQQLIGLLSPRRLLRSMVME